MKLIIVAALAAGLALPLVPAALASTLDTCAAFHCTGMELAQYVAPKEDEPDADADEAPEGGSQAPDAKKSPPDDEGDSNIAPPPSDAEPPGCIFQKGPLELIV